MGGRRPSATTMADEPIPFPAPLAEIIELFEFLPEDERRGALISYADNASRHASVEGETYDLKDIRKDEECTDTVGVFLNVGDGDKAGVSHRPRPPGPDPHACHDRQILCKGLNGSTLDEILAIPADFVPRIIGAELVRIRSQTVYYVLTRMKGAAKVYLGRRRAES